MPIKGVSRFLSRNVSFDHATVIQTKETEHVNLKVFSAFCIYPKQLLGLGRQRRRRVLEILGLAGQRAAGLHKRVFLCGWNNLAVQ